jgi:hypothetical protein
MTVAGLPVHPLVVHAVVMLIPLAALGAVLVAVRPAWRQIYGVPTLVLAVSGLACVPIATASGTALAADHGGHESAALELHIARADAVLPATIVFAVLLAAAVLMGRHADRATEPESAPLHARGDLDAGGTRPLRARRARRTGRDGARRAHRARRGYRSVGLLTSSSRGSAPNPGASLWWSVERRAAPQPLGRPEGMPQPRPARKR